MSSAALDTFGQLLMTEVRDRAIREWKMTVAGHMKGERCARIRQSLQRWSSQDRDLFLSLVPDIVDSVLHHLLWTLEEDGPVRVAVDLPDGEVPSLNEVSDGLAGELYTEDGWIARFSEEPSSWSAPPS
jgi:hypothetical protein